MLYYPCMKNINNNLINKTLIISFGTLAIFAMGILMVPAEAQAKFNTGYQNRTNLLFTPTPYLDPQ